MSEKIPEYLMKVIMRPGNVLYDIVDIEYRYEQKGILREKK